MKKADMLMKDPTSYLLSKGLQQRVKEDWGEHYAPYLGQRVPNSFRNYSKLNSLSQYVESDIQKELKETTKPLQEQAIRKYLFMEFDVKIQSNKAEYLSLYLTGDELEVFEARNEEVLGWYTQYSYLLQSQLQDAGTDSRAIAFKGLLLHYSKMDKRLVIQGIGIKQSILRSTIFAYREQMESHAISIQLLLYGEKSPALDDRIYYEDKKNPAKYHKRSKDQIREWEEKTRHPNVSLEIRLTQLPIFSFVRINDSMFISPYTVSAGERRPGILIHKWDNPEMFSSHLEHFEKAFSLDNPATSTT